MTEDAAVPPKVEPEKLVLRGSPGRIVRFRRGLVIATATLASTGLVAIAWVALEPPMTSAGPDASVRPAPVLGAPADALADAPRSYEEVPVLGPPLPGDLGRPIVRHQRSGDAAPDPEDLRQARQQLEAERSAAAAERKAARESGVMMPSSHTGRAAAEGGRQDPMAVPERQPPVSDGGEQHQSYVVSRMNDGREADRHGLTPPVSPYVLAAGSVIAASLITGLNSDLPGLVTAQVTENVYDSATGRTLLIPQGARLIGSYESDVAFGQRRALVVWQRIILPDGSSLRIDNMPASDGRGYAGLEDQVDRHSWQLVKAVVLSTLLGVGTELGIGGEGELLRAVREATQQGVARAGDQIVSKSLGIKPTITVRPGWPLRVVVNKDLVLRPWRG